MGDSAAYVSGKAVAQTWRPFWQVPVYMLALAAAVRFCHFALFEEPLLSLPSYLVDFAVAFAAAALGYRSCAPSRWARNTAGSIAARGRGVASAGSSAQIRRHGCSTMHTVDANRRDFAKLS